MSGLKLKGDIYVNRKNPDGTRTGRVQIGNGTAFSTTETVSRTDRVSKMRETEGNALDTLSQRNPTQLSFTIDDVTDFNLAMASLGLAEIVNVAAGSVTIEPAIAWLDGWLDLVNINVVDDASLIVTDDPGTTTYVKGTDYEVSARLGMIKPLSTGSIANGQPLKVDYNYGAKNGVLVRAGTQSEVVLEVFLDAINRVTNEHVHVKYHEAVMAPEGAVDLFADEWVPLTMAGTVKILDGQSEPYSYLRLDAE